MRNYKPKGKAPRFKDEVPEGYTGRPNRASGTPSFGTEKDHSKARLKAAVFPNVAAKSLDAQCVDCECKLGVEESVVLTDCMGDLMQVCFLCLGKRIADARS